MQAIGPTKCLITWQFRANNTISTDSKENGRADNFLFCFPVC